MSGKKIRADRAIKHQLLLDLVKEKGPLTRSDISRFSGITPLTVSKYINRLIEEGWLSETGVTVSTGGRKAHLLDISHALGPALGIEVGGSRLIYVVASYGGTVQDSLHHTLPADVPVFQVLCDQVESLLAQNPSIKTIGIASSGIVQSAAGLCLFSPHRSDMENLPLKNLLEERFGLPVFLDDISRCAAIAERRLGEKKGYDDHLFLYLDEGIGMSFFTQGHTCSGALGIEGEVGHFVIDQSGPRCGCGNRGCLEVFASTRAITGQVEKALERGVRSSVSRHEASIETIIQAGLEGDKLCYRVLSEAAERIGLVMAQVLNLTGIPFLVIGGRLAAAGPLLQEPVDRMVKTHSLSVLSRHWSVQMSSLDSQAGALGAAMLSLRQFSGFPPEWK